MVLPTDGFGDPASLATHVGDPSQDEDGLREQPDEDLPGPGPGVSSSGSVSGTLSGWKDWKEGMRNFWTLRRVL